MAKTRKQLELELKRSAIITLIVLLSALITISGTSFAWYIYSTSIHTTSVHLAAGSSSSLSICDTYDGDYSSTVKLAKFEDELVPVSTDKITAGFQKVTDFEGNEKENMKAISFAQADKTDYYVTSLYLKTGNDSTDVYLSGITFKDREVSDEDVNNHISTAIRVGFVFYTPGENGTPESEYIFEISEEKNPEANYNTKEGYQGCVLDSSRTDGTTIEFTPYSPENYASYDEDTAKVTLTADSLKLCTLHGNNGSEDDAVRVDVYVWLEGCDEDCFNNITGKYLDSLAVSFCGYTENS